MSSHSEIEATDLDKMSLIILNGEPIFNVVLDISLSLSRSSRASNVTDCVDSECGTERVTQ